MLRSWTRLRLRLTEHRLSRLELKQNRLELRLHLLQSSLLSLEPSNPEQQPPALMPPEVTSRLVRELVLRPSPISRLVLEPGEELPERLTFQIPNGSDKSSISSEPPAQP